VGGIRKSSYPWGAQVQRRVRQLERNRARRTGVIERMSADDAAYIAVLLRDPCSYCGIAGSQIDHIDATGPSTWQNFTSACTSCNTAKQQLPLLRFVLGGFIRRLRGRLDDELEDVQPEHFNRMRCVALAR
jgi:5-methylcytosine-specific restriction endonuclease McrA